MSNIQFRIAAKTDVGLVRTNNEDNFQASSDLSKNQMRWINNEVCSLGDKGALIVVADGMGGMNAGEVASELAIETVREYFSLENLTADVMKTRYSIEKFMNEVIVAADARIKEEARRNPETKGMGTTIVIGWILDGKLYVSWCGDSRAYVYNPAAGLHQITKDHSYVQGLVDKGSITREEAFDFPDSNIITRCLSDSTAKAKPESLLKPYDLCDGDIILLCTDGLSGMIRDSEMEAIIRANEQDMDVLVDELIKVACEAEGSDNITICICQILRGASQCKPEVFTDYDKRNNGNQTGFIKTIINKQEDISGKRRGWLYILLACVALALIGICVWWFFLKEKGDKNIQQNIPEAIEMQDAPMDVQTEDASIQSESADSNDESQSDAIVDAVPSTNQQTSQKGKGKTGSSGSVFDGPKQESPKEQATDKDEDELTLIGNIEDPKPAKQQEEEATPVYQDYMVKRGDTYSKLAKRFNTDVETLQKINNGKDLKEGDTIKVPK
ncbi:MAG: protein phosphatase 2C domain-containing protein [Muribaculaceae bacterium]|nr:protein phosphatase 2C domain-containing protein [Muribaculaceae bacterium]